MYSTQAYAAAVALIVVIIIIVVLAVRYDEREKMSVGAHWDGDAAYGHSADTLPSFGLSGYNEGVPTPSWA